MELRESHLTLEKVISIFVNKMECTYKNNVIEPRNSNAGFVVDTSFHSPVAGIFVYNKICTSKSLNDLEFRNTIFDKNAYRLGPTFAPIQAHMSISINNIKSVEVNDKGILSLIMEDSSLITIIRCESI